MNFIFACNKISCTNNFYIKIVKYKKQILENTLFIRSVF